MRKRITVWSLLLLATLVLGGCAQQSETPEEAAPSEPAAPEAPVEAAAVEVTPEMEVLLAAADRVDGSEDGVVANCPGCGLGMAGSEEYAVPVGDYTVRFCSSSCKEAFEENVSEAVLAMTIPEQK
jgi:hypothetical protein